MSVPAPSLIQDPPRPRRRRLGVDRLVVLGAVVLNLFAAAAVLLFLSPLRSQLHAAAATTTQNLAELLGKNYVAGELRDTLRRALSSVKLRGMSPAVPVGA